MIEELVKQGFELLKQFDTQEAVKFFQSLRKSYPNEKKVLFGFACALILRSEEVKPSQQKRMLKQARILLEEAVKIDPGYDEACAKLQEIEEKLTVLDGPSLVASVFGNRASTVHVEHQGGGAAQTGSGYSTLITIFDKTLVRQEEIGRGSFGVVYCGQYGGDRVAIKRIVISVQQRKEGIFKTFLSEAAIMLALHSPYLLRCQDVVITADGYYLVLDYMPKGSLWQWLHDSNRSFNLDQQTQITTDVIRGLVALHDKNIIHGDLKSPNVLVDHYDRVKLADFDLPKVKTVVTGANMVGTLAWLAPEILIHRKDHSKTTDVYSLGLIFWEIVTRLSPYKDKDALGVWHAKMRCEHEKIPENCPPQFSQLIQRCWFAPERRPSAKELLAWRQSVPFSSRFNFQLAGPATSQIAEWSVSPQGH